AVRSRQAVFYRWDRELQEASTLRASFDWALCVPLPEPISAGWALYAAGHVLSPPGVKAPDAAPTGDLQFAGVVADIFASLHGVCKLQAGQGKGPPSLALAHEIQAGFSPRTLPALEGYDLAAGSRPAEATGGDYYDALSLPSGRLGLVVAD